MANEWSGWYAQAWSYLTERSVVSNLSVSNKLVDVEFDEERSSPVGTWFVLVT